MKFTSFALATVFIASRAEAFTAAGISKPRFALQQVSLPFETEMFVQIAVDCTQFHAKILGPMNQLM